MSFSIGKVLSSPFSALASVAKNVAPVAIEALRGVVNVGAEFAKFGANAASYPYYQSPMGYFGSPAAMGIQGLQNAANMGLSALSSAITGRPVDGSMLYPPAFDTRFGMPGGFAGTWGTAQIFGQFPATAGWNGWLPTGNNTYDTANYVANAPMYSPTEMALLNQIEDPKQRAIQALQMQMQKQALLCTVLTNLANMRHEMLKAVADNLRA